MNIAGVWNAFSTVPIWEGWGKINPPYFDSICTWQIIFYAKKMKILLRFRNPNIFKSMSLDFSVPSLVELISLLT